MKRCVKCQMLFEKREIRPEDAGKAFAHRYCLSCLAKRPTLPVIESSAFAEALEDGRVNTIKSHLPSKAAAKEHLAEYRAGVAA